MVLCWGSRRGPGPRVPGCGWQWTRICLGAEKRLRLELHAGADQRKICRKEVTLRWVMGGRQTLISGLICKPMNSIHICIALLKKPTIGDTALFLFCCRPKGSSVIFFFSVEQSPKMEGLGQTPQFSPPLGRLGVLIKSQLFSENYV